MRTKNAKRFWPVPVTLGVMALAALLAVGLLVATDAQPAAAQDDADCEIYIDNDGMIVTVANTGDPNPSNNKPATRLVTPQVVWRRSRSLALHKEMTMALRRMVKTTRTCSMCCRKTAGATCNTTRSTRSIKETGQ